MFFNENRDDKMLKNEIARVEQLRRKYKKEIVPKVPAAAATQAFITECLDRARRVLLSRQRPCYAPILVELRNYRH